eukprot:NP_001263704.1 Uncharacterized protein CELE_R144.19 [Caenorhabditis elegans]
MPQRLLNLFREVLEYSYFNILLALNCSKISNFGKFEILCIYSTFCSLIPIFNLH